MKSVTGHMGQPKYSQHREAQVVSLKDRSCVNILTIIFTRGAQTSLKVATSVVQQIAAERQYNKQTEQNRWRRDSHVCVRV